MSSSEPPIPLTELRRADGGYASDRASVGSRSNVERRIMESNITSASEAGHRQADNPDGLVATDTQRDIHTAQVTGQYGPHSNLSAGHLSRRSQEADAPSSPPRSAGLDGHHPVVHEDDLVALEEGHAGRKESASGTQERDPDGAADERNAERKRLFGIRLPPPRHGGQWQGRYNTNDYEQKYPDDEMNEEMGPNARIWHVYLDEAEAFDADMIDGWKDTIDVLLVFAGLFSAVLTTFVVQTAQALQPDYSQVTASLLTELVSLQRAGSQNQSIAAIPQSSMNATSPFAAASSDLWVNGLWFTSLCLSLATALFSVLVKQWLQHYVSAVSVGSTRARAHIRQFRFHGLQTWHVRGIIGWLPVLMHMSLLVFFAGLIVFLKPLNVVISWITISIVALTFGAYLTTNVLPLIYSECPYKTSLTYHIELLYDKATQGGLMILKKIRIKDIAWLENLPHLTLQEQELQSIQCIDEILDEQSIQWLYETCSNPTITSIIVQALSDSKNIDLFNWKGNIKYELLQVEKLSQYVFPMHISEMNDYKALQGLERFLRTSLLSLDPNILDNNQYNQPRTHTLFYGQADKLGAIANLGSKANLSQLTLLAFHAQIISDIEMIKIHKNIDIAKLTDTFKLLISSLNNVNDIGNFVSAHYQQLKSIAHSSTILFDHEKQIFALLLLNILYNIYKSDKTNLQNQDIHLIIYTLYGIYHIDYEKLYKWKDSKELPYCETCINLIIKGIKLDKATCQLILLDVWKHILESFNQNDGEVKIVTAIFEYIQIICSDFDKDILVKQAPMEITSVITNIINSVCKETYTFMSNLVQVIFWDREPHDVQTIIKKLEPFFQSKQISRQQWDISLTTAIIKYLKETSSDYTIKDELINLLQKLIDLGIMVVNDFILLDGMQIVQNKYDRCHMRVVKKLFGYKFKNYSLHSNEMLLDYLSQPHVLLYSTRLICAHLQSITEEYDQTFSKHGIISASSIRGLIQNMHMKEEKNLYTDTVWQTLFDPLTKDIKKSTIKHDINKWHDILQTMLQATRYCHIFNVEWKSNYTKIFDNIEKLKFLLDVDLLDQKFILYEYEIEATDDREEIHNNLQLYPEVIAPNEWQYKIVKRTKYVSEKQAC